MAGHRSRCVGWCGSCYTNVRGRTNKKGHRSYREPVALPFGVLKTMPISRRPKQDERAGGGPCATLAGLILQYPLLHEQLTADTFDDGGPRKTATLLLFVDEGCLKGCLNDRAEQQTLWASAVGVEGVLAGLEGMLGDEVPGWRPYRMTGGKGKR